MFGAGRGCRLRYKDNVVERICAAEWPPSVVVRLAKTLQDVDMSAARLRAVVAKVLAQIGLLPLEELPSLVYQLLLLSSRGTVAATRSVPCIPSDAQLRSRLRCCWCQDTAPTCCAASCVSSTRLMRNARSTTRTATMRP